MINILTRNHFVVEKKYIIDTIFKNFLGIDYKLVNQEEGEDYEVVLENGNKLIIRDNFFKNFGNELDYLLEKNIPEKITFIKNPFLTENDIPVIYGNNELLISQNKIICGIDIFASIFFMLTRWEEYVSKTRDNHNRFPAYASLAYKKGFLNRPVVNEYVEMLWNMFLKLGINQKRKERKFRMFLSHDVDVPFGQISVKFPALITSCLGDVIKRKDPGYHWTDVNGMVCS